MGQLVTVFVTVFLAELGDKTQVATLLFASERGLSPAGVFVASALALVLSTAIAVLLGGFASRYLAMLPIRLLAGIGFTVIGVWTIVQYYRGA